MLLDWKEENFNAELTLGCHRIAVNLAGGLVRPPGYRSPGLRIKRLP
jgi:hypothetical protein